MGEEIVNQVQEAQRVPGRINPRRNTPRHIVIKLTKIKDRDKILKATRGTHVHPRWIQVNIWQNQYSIVK